MSTQAHLQQLLDFETRTIRVAIPVTKVARRPRKKHGAILVAAGLAAVLFAAFLMAVASQFAFGLFIEQMQQIHRDGSVQAAYSAVGEMSR
jgi:hypothetical protein